MKQYKHIVEKDTSFTKNECFFFNVLLHQAYVNIGQCQWKGFKDRI